ncbi:TIGR02147 family protein [Bacteriovoracaceae bacterium]|nr:TIGR02147 family protein [Bacteriovoracaceae bacterium]
MQTNIYDYLDADSYISTAWKEAKSINKNLSYEYLARKLELESNSLISMVVRGKRFPTDKILTGLIETFQLENEQKDYLKLLIELKRNKNDIVFSSHLVDLLKRHSKVNYEKFQETTFKTIAHWEYYLIRELVKCRDFKNDINWIHEKVKESIEKEEIKNILKDLIHLGLLHEDEDNNLTASQSHFCGPHGESSEANKRLHKDLLEQVKNKIDYTFPEERYISSICLSLDKSRMPEFIKTIESFENEFINKYEEEGDEVYFFNLQLFSFTGTKNA